MHIDNVHERTIDAPPAAVGGLLDTLSSARRPALAPATLATDALRRAPRCRRPRRARLRPLPRRRLRARARGSSSRSIPASASTATTGSWSNRSTTDHCVLRHEMHADAHGAVALDWILVIRALHDACVEDALDCAEHAATGDVRAPARWSVGVRFLRRWVRGRSREQAVAGATTTTTPSRLDRFLPGLRRGRAPRDRRRRAGRGRVGRRPRSRPGPLARRRGAARGAGHPRPLTGKRPQLPRHVGLDTIVANGFVRPRRGPAARARARRGRPVLAAHERHQPGHRRRVRRRSTSPTSPRACGTSPSTPTAPTAPSWPPRPGCTAPTVPPSGSSCATGELVGPFSASRSASCCSARSPAPLARRAWRHHDHRC